MGIVRQEMDKIGQEFFLPALHPRELWEGQRALGFDGRKPVSPERPQRRRHVPGHDRRRGVTEIASKELRSYKQLPQIWYQIATKFRRRAAAQVGPFCGCGSS